MKTNIGHLEAGSGIAGLIKTALALHHQEIPGNLHFEKPNPDIDFQRLKLHVPTHLEPWPASDGPALAGINSFGFGGTNAHIVMQSAPVQPTAEMAADAVPASSVLIPLSARSPEALGAAAADLREFVSNSESDISLHDIAVNTAEHRTHHNHRLAIVAHTKERVSRDIIGFWRRRAGAICHDRTVVVRTTAHCLRLFGTGPAVVGDGTPVVEPQNRCFARRSWNAMRSSGILARGRSVEELTVDESRSRMAETAISQPAIFAIQVALAALWESWGVLPEAVIGHSVGEVAAAYLAGLFDLEDAVRIIYHRGRCMDRASSRGRMLAVGLSGDEARRLIEERGNRVSLAAINAPDSTTLSGETEPPGRNCQASGRAKYLLPLSPGELRLPQRPDGPCPRRTADLSQGHPPSKSEIALLFHSDGQAN